MQEAKQSSVAAALLILTVAFLKDGASSIQVDVSPRDPTVRVGQNFTFMCRVAKPLMYCRIEMPGLSSGLNMNEKVPRTSEYWYAGEGIKYGQCGITISHMVDRQNGRFKCTLGFSDEQIELEGTTIVTVARPPQNGPELTITPEVDPRFGTYSEGTPIKAMCTVTDARPAANLLWFMGDDQIMDGVGPPEIVESPTDLFTVHQNLTRRLTWRDNRKDLKCVATHIALDGEVKPTVIQISVRFAPRPIDGTVKQFGFIVGEEGIIYVQIHANPKPKLTWTVDQDSFPEGSMDLTQRFEATSAGDMGNGTWEAQLRILRVSAEDVAREYVLRARNDIGEQQYIVRISTSAEPQGSLELGTGPIIGIVVAILVVLVIIFMVIFARATGRWCFSGGISAKHDNRESETFIRDSQTQGSNPNKGDNPPDEQKSLTATVKEKESSDTESADHGPAERSKKPRMNLTYILKKKKDKVAADVGDLKLQNVAMETEKEIEKCGTESSEHIATPARSKPCGPDVVYAELELQSMQRPVVRRDDDKTEYAEIIHTKSEEEGDGIQ